MNTDYADACMELEDALASLCSRLGNVLTNAELAAELRRYAKQIESEVASHSPETE